MWPMKVNEEAFCSCKFEDIETINPENVEFEFQQIKEHYGFETMRLHALQHQLKHCNKNYIQIMAHQEMLYH